MRSISGDVSVVYIAILTSQGQSPRDWASAGDPCVSGGWEHPRKLLLEM